jgi:thiosulfate/3-mercaptopyruvate sulfurtransferase
MALAAVLAVGPAPVLLDVRWRLGGPPGLDRYREGHLPGARFVDLDRDLAGPPTARGAGGPGSPGAGEPEAGEPGGRHPLPDADAFEAAMRRAGVDDGRPVLVYDESDSMAAARAWWLLRYFGHQQVQVLDGGYQAWLAADEPIETGPAPAPPPGNFTARPGYLPLLDAAGAARIAREGVLLDARAAERYRGEVEPVDPVAGHIPDAVSAPTTENLGPAGRFLDPEALRARFAGLGVPAAAAVPAGAPAGGLRTGDVPPGDVPPGGVAADGAVTTGVYCGSGVTAAHEVLALSLAGIPAALYVGSWSDWITDPARAVVTGPAPR